MSVNLLTHHLTTPPHNIPTLALSLDDIYLPHASQKTLAATHPDYPLISHRGQPSTHDLPLGLDVFRKLSRGETCKVPRYDKSAFNGEGDRADEGTWRVVNADGGGDAKERKIEIVIFEGWCVGFRPLGDEELVKRWEKACEEKREESRLWRHSIDELRFINHALEDYDALTSYLNTLIHINALHPLSVYTWRLDQERHLRATTGGGGMTDDQVVNFVHGYYPSYELYGEGLRNGGLGSEVGGKVERGDGGVERGGEGEEMDGEERNKKGEKEKDEESDGKKDGDKGEGRQLEITIGEEREVVAVRRI
ncbi:MAG: hypothetical protein M1817_006240 [Caeruleum heppii]|nr:MAG: hypothetical protein M1817_006240 [Caeruleum heppii]